MVVLFIVLGKIYYSTNDNAGILADTGLNLSVVKSELSTNDPFLVTVMDTEATQSDEIDLSAEAESAIIPTKHVSETLIPLPMGLKFDELGTKQLNDGNNIAVISFDEVNRNLSINWNESSKAGKLEVSLVPEEIGTYQLVATKTVNNQLNESEPLKIEVTEATKEEVKEEATAEIKPEEEPVVESKEAQPIAQSSIITAFGPETAIAANDAELSTAIKDPLITQIYLSNSFNLTTRTKVPNEKKYMRISGKNPLTGEIHTLTERNGTIGGTDNIYVSNSNSDPKDYGFEDIKIIGLNYYGPMNVQDSTNEVTLSYTNVDYQGPQITHNVNGITKYLGNTTITIAQVQSGSASNQEVAEARNVILDGNITINHTSVGDSMFWLGLSGGSENSFTIKENSNVLIDSKGNGMFYRNGTNAIAMDIEKNAKVKITTNNGLFRNNPGKYLHVAEDADVEFEKTGGDQPVLRLAEDVYVAPGARLSMKATGGSGYFARFEGNYAGTSLNFDNPLSVLLYNKTSQRMFDWSTMSTGKMHIDAIGVNYWRVAGTGDRNDTALFNWTMPDKSNVLTDLTTNGGTTTTITSTNAGMNGTDFNLGTAKVISLGAIDVTLDPITDAQDKVTGTATKGSKVFIDYTEEGVSKTLEGIASADGKYSIDIPNGFIKPYIDVTATANLDFRTKISSAVKVQDVTPPEGTGVIQVFDKGSQFPTDFTPFVKDIKDKSDNTAGAGVTVSAGSLPQPDMNQAGPVLPMYEVILTDKAGHTTPVKVPIFIRDEDTATSGTTALRGKNVTFKLPQYPQTEAELKTFIQSLSGTEAWDLATGTQLTDLSTLTVDVSKMKEAVGTYPVIFTFGNVSKEIQVSVTPGIGTVNVHYQDEVGNKLAEDKVIVDDVGNPYSESSIPLNGYEYLRTQGAASGVIEDQPQDVTFVYKQNRFKLIQSVEKLDGSSGATATLTERIQFKTQLSSQLAEETPAVFYKAFTITIPIDDKLTDIGDFTLVTDDGSAKGNVVYDEANKVLTATITEADQLDWSKNLTLSYKGTVKDNVALASIISSKAEASGNYTNNWVADMVASNTTQTDVLDGSLIFTSAPSTIDFGDDLKIVSGSKKYPIQSMVGSLTIQDTRLTKSPWLLTAKMDQILTSSTNKTLPNALKYTNNGIQQDLGTDLITIYEDTNTGSVPVNISDSWIPNGDGLSLNVQTEEVYPEEYTGSITWTLQDAP